MRIELQLAVASQQDFEDGKDQGGIQFENRIPIVRLEAKRRDAGGGRKTFEKLRVGELLDAHQVDDQVRAQVCRQAGNQVPHEIIVELMDGPQLRLGNAVGTPEVEQSRPLGTRALRLAALDILKDRIDFLLTELSCHGLIYAM